MLRVRFGLIRVRAQRRKIVRCFDVRHVDVNARGRFISFHTTIRSAFEAFQSGIGEVVPPFKRVLGRSGRDLDDLCDMGMHCELSRRRVDVQRFPKKIGKIQDPILAPPYEPRTEAVSHHYPRLKTRM